MKEQSAVSVPGHNSATFERPRHSLNEEARAKHCDGMAGIVEEGQSIMEQAFDATSADARLIAAAQRVEHYEMTAGRSRHRGRPSCSAWAVEVTTTRPLVFGLVDAPMATGRCCARIRLTGIEAVSAAVKSADRNVL
jgi:hypothetical protein